MIELFEIIIRHQLGFYVPDGIAQTGNEFIEIFFIQENLVFIVAVPICLSFALCYRDIIIVSAGCFHVKEISTFAGFYPFRKNLVSVCITGIVHCTVFKAVVKLYYKINKNKNMH
jgi:hypothetical protein